MTKISRYKVEYGILIPIIIFSIISIVTIFSGQSLLPSTVGNLALRQTFWFIVGFGIAYLIMTISNEYIYRYYWILYILGVISLLFLLLFADPINGARCWFAIPNVGTIQPSEFMKIILIITIAVIINNHNEKYSNPSVKKEFRLILKIFIVTLIPSILTFLQPDTGIVIIYIVIMFVMLVVSGIRYKWFVLFFIISILFSVLFFVFFYLNSTLFIDVFGADFFYRIDRLLDWKDGVGMQLGNALTGIGSAGLIGFGFNHNPIYFPEAHTDFIFSVYAINFGFVGVFLLISLIVFFDIKLANMIYKSGNNTNKYVIGGIIAMIIYQQIQSIGMNVGLLPITGITLPYISYGGSSLISYMIMTGLIFNVSNESLRYTNKKSL